jgi:hypothetical protein
VRQRRQPDRDGQRLGERKAVRPPLTGIAIDRQNARANRAFCFYHPRMRNVAVLGVSLASLCFVFARSPEERTVTDPASITSPRNANAAPVPIDDLFFSRSVSGASWSPDGKEIVFGTNTTGRINLWKVASSGGWPVQLAVADDRQVSPVWSPDGKWIVWQQDRGGNEAYDLYAIPAAGGAPSNLTNTPAISETSALFSPDAKWLALDYKGTTTPQTDVAILNLGTKTVRNLTNEKTADRTWSVVAWSPDGNSLYANRSNPDDTMGEVYRIDETGQHQCQRSIPRRQDAADHYERERLRKRNASQRRHEDHDAGDVRALGSECR